MKLDLYYSIDKDAHNVILVKTVNKGISAKTQKPTISVEERYYPDVPSALGAYIKLCAKDAVTPNASAKEIIDAIETATKNIKQ